MWLFKFIYMWQSNIWFSYQQVTLLQLPASKQKLGGVDQSFRSRYFCQDVILLKRKWFPFGFPDTTPSNYLYVLICEGSLSFLSKAFLINLRAFLPVNANKPISKCSWTQAWQIQWVSTRKHQYIHTLSNRLTIC